MNKYFQITLLFLMTVRILFAQLPQMQIAGQPEKESSEFVGSNIKDPNGRICAAVKIVSNLKGLEYTAYNGVEKVDRQPGMDMVYLQPDERVLELFHSDYKPLKIILSEVGIKLNSKQIWKIEISGEATVGDLLPVTLLVQPQDATITIDNKTYPPNQAIKLSKGRHQLRLTKQGFKTKSETINVSESSVFFNYTLIEVDLEQVVIKSIPVEARIYLDNVEKGVTDKGLFLYPGQYQLKLSKTGYLEVNENINVTEGGSNTFSYNLDKNSGSLSLNITPAGATVLINKEDYSNRSNIELAPGRYKIEITKSGYKPQDETVTIERGRTLQKAYTLLARTGKLQFNIQPLTATADLVIDGKSVRKWKGMNILNDLPVGQYDLFAEAKNYVGKRAVVHIRENETTILEMTLEKIEQALAAAGSSTIDFSGCAPQKTFPVFEQYTESMTDMEKRMAYSFGFEYYKNKSYDKALPYLLKVFFNNDDKYARNAVAKIADIYFNKKDVEKTFYICYEGLKKFPDLIRLHYYTGILQSKLENYQCAIPHLQKVVKGTKNNILVLQALSSAYYKINDKRAITVQEMIVREKPEDELEKQKLNAFKEYFEINGLLGNSNKSKEETVNTKSSNLSVTIQSAQKYINNHQFGKAYRLILKFVVDHPEDISTFYYLGRVCEEAADHYVKLNNKVTYEDKLVYEKAFLYYSKAKSDPDVKQMSIMSLSEVKSKLPTKEDKFMHQNGKIKSDRYSWLKK